MRRTPQSPRSQPKSCSFLFPSCPFCLCLAFPARPLLFLCSALEAWGCRSRKGICSLCVLLDNLWLYDWYSPGMSFSQRRGILSEGLSCCLAQATKATPGFFLYLQETTEMSFHIDLDGGKNPRLRAGRPVPVLDDIHSSIWLLPTTSNPNRPSASTSV
jgi:hypothetical protein